MLQKLKIISYAFIVALVAITVFPAAAFSQAEGEESRPEPSDTQGYGNVLLVF